MPSEEKFQRVAPDDPTRCQATHNDQQCPYKSVEGSKFCQRHSGASNNLEAKEYRNKYLVAKYQDRIGKQATHPQIKSLADEIGICRMILEARLNQCKEDTELLMYGNQINQLVQTITTCIEKWHRIEMSTNVVMDRTQALDFIHALSELLYNILSKVFEKASILDELAPTLKQISDEMITELGRRTDYSIRTKQST